MRVSYTHQLHGGNVSLTLYRQVQNGVLLPVYVNGVVLNQLGELPPGYLAAGCSRSTTLRPAATRRRARRLSAQQLYFTTPVAGVQRLYQGAELTGYVTLGNLVVQPYYNLTGAQAELEQLYLRQSVVDHDSGPTASQRAAAEGRHRARL